MDHPSTSRGNQELAKALDDRIGELSAVAHAALAQVAKASAEFDAICGWGAGGIRSFPHWLTIKTGFDMYTGAELLRVGQAMGMLPKIAAAFEAGQLSFDKARQVTTVATPATEEFLLEIARGASGAQLARICRSLRRIAEADAHEQADDHLARRGLWMHWDEHGMLELKAKLTPEGAAVPAYRTEAHHHEHWAMGGETNLGDLLLLCGFHHRRHHSGAFRIRKTANGFSFETDDGHVIQPPPRDPVTLERHPDIGPSTPFSLWGGEALEFGYAVSVIADACEFAATRAAPGQM